MKFLTSGLYSVKDMLSLNFICTTNSKTLLLHPRLTQRTDFNAGLAEPVDAMVSNTIVRKDMPVRVRHPVH